MSPDQPTNFEEPSVEANSGGVNPNSPPRSPHRHNSHRKVRLALLVFGVPASALAIVAGELAFTYSVAPTKEVSAMGMTMPSPTKALTGYLAQTGKLRKIDHNLLCLMALQG